MIGQLNIGTKLYKNFPLVHIDRKKNALNVNSVTWIPLVHVQAQVFQN